MKKILQAASVASLVLLSAVGCSNCCGSRTTSASAPCANGNCATPATGSAMTSGYTNTTSPMTMTTAPGKNPMIPANQMPASGSMTPVGSGSGTPMLIPQQ